MSTNTNEAQFGSLDDLFSASLDDIADLPSFETPPKGAYVGRITLDIKEVNKKPAIEARFVIDETVELEAVPGDVQPDAPKPGSEFSTAFILGSNIAEGKLKQLLAPFAEHFNDSSVGNLVRDHVKDVTIAFTMKHRVDKEDKEKVYADVRNITVA